MTDNDASVQVQDSEFKPVGSAAICAALERTSNCFHFFLLFFSLKILLQLG